MGDKLISPKNFILIYHLKIIYIEMGKLKGWNNWCTFPMMRNKITPSFEDDLSPSTDIDVMRKNSQWEASIHTAIDQW